MEGGQMSECEQRRVLIVSNNGQGISKEVKKTGFVIVTLIPHNKWAQHIGEMRQSYLVILDEVDQFISGNLRLTDEEERILYGGDLFVLVLVRDDDYRLDERAQLHKRWIVHHKSQPLKPCLQPLFLHAPLGAYSELVLPS